MKKWKRILFRRQETASNPDVSDLIVRCFGYKPKARDLFVLAITHSSAAEKNKEGVRMSNERLEFLGDAIIDAVMADYLYHEFPSLSEGELTKMKAKIVSRKSLNYIGDKIGLANFLICKIGNQEMHKSMLGNAFEAVVGAVYLEKGYSFTFEKLLKLFKKFEVDELVHEVTDYKSRLHEWCQKNRKHLKYKVIKEEQFKGSSSYTIEVYINGLASGVGEGKSKKHAEQEASKKACESLIHA